MGNERQDQDPETRGLGVFGMLSEILGRILGRRFRNDDRPSACQLVTQAVQRWTLSSEGEHVARQTQYAPAYILVER